MTARLQPGARIGGRFEIISMAASGGMGAVYRASDLQTGELVALKLLTLSSSDQMALDRFDREARLLRDLVTPGVVRYIAHGIGEDSGPFLAMEWLEGEDLTARLRRQSLSVAESLSLISSVASGLAVVHKRGVVHRDIKPGNIFLRDREVSKAVLLDFGIARLGAPEQSVTRTGYIVGTPEYMSPEQARGQREITAATDIFSLGCVLFECLTGVPPFSGDHVAAVLGRILFGTAPRLSSHRHDLPASLEGLIEQMLKKEPAERLPDASALLTLLRNLRVETSTRVVSAMDATQMAPKGLLLSMVEHSLVSIIVATVGAQLDLAETQAAPGTTAGDNSVIAAIVQLGAHAEILADGTLIASITPNAGNPMATDLAIRAARCALLVKEHLPSSTVALTIGLGRREQRLPMGEVVDRAMALLANPDGLPPEFVLVDQVTAGLIEARFELTPLSEGRSGFRGERLRAETARRLLGRPTNYVGRERELHTLETSYRQCVDEESPVAVLVLAAAGLGKSRLRHEALRRLTGSGEPQLLLCGEAQELHSGTSFGVLGQAVRQLCGILDNEALAARRAKLQQRIGTSLPAANRARITAFLGELCAIPFEPDFSPALRAARQDPKLMGEQIRAAFMDWLKAESERAPVLMVLEDLHWADERTVWLLEQLPRTLRECPVMVMAFGRPESTERFPQLRNSSIQVIQLRPLSKKVSARWVSQILESLVPSELLSEIVSQIVEQADGNPLFMEELIRAAAEGQRDLRPGTVLAMLQSRLVHMDGLSRLLLRAASVFGESFWPGGLRHLLGEIPEAECAGVLQSLVEQEVIERRDSGRLEGEEEFRFRHAMMCAAAYGLLTEDDKRLGHRLAADFLEKAGEQDPYVLAEHCRRAGLNERAVPYYILAATRSYNANDLAGAGAYTERGLSCGAANAERGVLLTLRALVDARAMKLPEAHQAAKEATELVPKGTVEWCRAAEGVLMMTMYLGRVAEFAEFNRQFLATDPLPSARVAYVTTAATLTMLFASSMRRHETQLTRQRMLDICGQVDKRDLRAFAVVSWAESDYSRTLQVNHDKQVRELARAVELCETIGDRLYTVALRAFLGQAHSESGDQDTAVSLLRTALEEAQASGEAYLLSTVRIHLAAALSLEESTKAQDEAVKLLQEIRAAAGTSPGYRRWAAALLARAALRAGNAAEAVELAKEGLDPMPSATLRRHLAMVTLIRAHLACDAKTEALELAEAEQKLLDERGGAGYSEIPVRLVIAEARSACGDLAGAAAAIAAGMTELERRAETIADRNLRRRFLNEMPEHVRLSALAKRLLSQFEETAAP